MERDPRWERVSGGMSRWTYPGDDDPIGVRVDIEVVSPTGHRVTQTCVVADDMRESVAVDPMPYVLSKMVRRLDEAMHS